MNHGPGKQARDLLRHPAWAIPLMALPMLMSVRGGPVVVDDAYITFRYAANLAAGKGFVYNAEPILGTTTPLYTLLLAVASRVGADIESAAVAIGVGSAMVCCLLVWRLGVAVRDPGAGLLGGMLLGSMPVWWLNAGTGMESTLAAALMTWCLLAWLRGKILIAGAVAGLLVLTRPDTALLPVVLCLAGGIRSRRAVLFGTAGLAVVLPWIAWATVTFSSPAPQSLAAKRLIHPVSLIEGLRSHVGWFLSVNEGIVALTALWLVGCYFILRRRHEAAVLVYWPPVFIAGLVATGVMPFFWYRVPVLPVLCFGAGCGVLAVARHRSFPGRAGPLGAALLVIGAGGFQIWQARDWVASPEQKARFVAKEAVLRSLADRVASHAASTGRSLSDVTVLVGEVGVVGYRLLAAEVVDSAGINSLKVYDLRRADLERLVEKGARMTPRQLREQSPEWVKATIRQFQPQYILSDRRYLHLRSLMAEPSFSRSYRMLDSVRSPRTVFVLLAARDTGVGEAE